MAGGRGGGGGRREKALTEGSKMEECVERFAQFLQISLSVKVLQLNLGRYDNRVCNGNMDTLGIQPFVLCIECTVWRDIFVGKKFRGFHGFEGSHIDICKTTKILIHEKFRYTIPFLFWRVLEISYCGKG